MIYFYFLHEIITKRKKKIKVIKNNKLSKKSSNTYTYLCKNTSRPIRYLDVACSEGSRHCHLEWQCLFSSRDVCQPFGHLLPKWVWLRWLINNYVGHQMLTINHVTGHKLAVLIDNRHSYCPFPWFHLLLSPVWRHVPG